MVERNTVRFDDDFEPRRWVLRSTMLFRQDGGACCSTATPIRSSTDATSRPPWSCFRERAKRFLRPCLDQPLETYPVGVIAHDLGGAHDLEYAPSMSATRAT
jgi:hypothetical protein